MSDAKISALPSAATLTGAERLPVSQSNQTRGATAAQLLSSSLFTQTGTGAVARSINSKFGDIVSVRDFGALGDGVTDDTAAIQAAVDSLVAGQTLLINVFCRCTGITITNKNDIYITGKGGLTLFAAASNAMIFKFVGTCDNVVIDGLKLVGENNAAYTQIGIGNFSGQTLSNIWLLRNKISQINNGISMTAEGAGSYTKGWALFNTIKDCPGTGAGQGTGIHNGITTYCTIAWNVVDNASRNSYYQASGTDTGNVWAYNKALNHRSSVFTGGVAPAINILRSSGVLVAYNECENCYDGGMLVQHESSSSTNCKDIEVIGNVFRNRKNAVSHMYLGESAVPSGFETTHVRVMGNKFFSDESVAGAGSAEVTFYNGRLLEFSNNTLRKTNVGAAAVFVVYGLDAAIGATADFTDNCAKHNRFIAEGTVLTDVSAFSCGADVSATYQSVHRFDNRDFTNIVYPVRHALATPTNPNLMVLVDHRAYVVGTGATVGAGTTAGKMRTNAAARIIYSRTVASFASTDNVWDLTAVSTGVGQFRKVLLCLQDAAAAAIIVGEIAATQAAAKLPGLPDARWAALGVVEIPASYAGGALGAVTFYDIVGIYEP